MSAERKTQSAEPKPRTSAVKIRIDQAEATWLAESITHALFTNGLNRTGDQLCLYENQSYLGGWCRSAVVNQIKEVIRRFNCPIPQ